MFTLSCVSLSPPSVGPLPRRRGRHRRSGGPRDRPPPCTTDPNRYDSRLAPVVTRRTHTDQQSRSRTSYYRPQSLLLLSSNTACCTDTITVVRSFCALSTQRSVRARPRDLSVVAIVPVPIRTHCALRHVPLCLWYRRSFDVLRVFSRYPRSKTPHHDRRLRTQETTHAEAQTLRGPLPHVE